MEGPSKRSFGFCTRRTRGYTILPMMHRGEEVIPPMDFGMQLERRMVTKWPNNGKCLLFCLNIGHFMKFFSLISCHTCCTPPSSQASHLVLSCSLLSCLMLLYLPDRPFYSFPWWKSTHSADSSSTFQAGGGPPWMVLNSSSHIIVRAMILAQNELRASCSTDCWALPLRFLTQ